MAFSFGDIVRVVDAPESVEQGVAGGTGMVVSVNVTVSEREILGGGELADAVLVSLEEPVEGTILIAGRLLATTGETTEWEIVDGLAEARGGHEDTVEAERVRVRSTPETNRLGLAGLVGEVMGETIPSSSGVTEIVGGTDSDYAINAWFEKRREQHWFHPDLLEPTE